MIALPKLASVGLLTGCAAISQATAIAQSTASFEQQMLGAPCHDNYQLSSDTWAEQRVIQSRHDAAMKRGDTGTVIAMRKALIRQQCHNDYLWFFLAEYYVQTGKHDQAVAVLEYLYSKKNNEVERRLRADTDLRPLVESGPFQASELAKSLAADREKLAQRRQALREKIAALSANEQPPANYVAEGACPFECCVFRTWDVLADTVLYGRPKGDTVAGRVGKGDKVEGLTGEVHIKPIPIVVRYQPARSNVPAGSVVFLLDRLGEGIGRVWYEGQVLELDVAGIYDHCPFPSADCWGEHVDTVTQDDRWGTWWVKVKTGSGVIGWTKEHENFGNLDGCV